jgi:hypothetical protein
MRHPAAVRAYSSMLRLLSERGHEVHLAFRRIKTSESHRELQRLTDECPGLTFGGVPPVGRGVSARTLGFALLAEQLRHDTDYLRYLAPVYSDAASLRKRAAARAGRGVRGLARVGGGRGVPLLRGVVDAAEASIEPHPNVVEYLAERRPDVVLVSHLAEFGSGQTDYVRAARRLGIHTAYPVFSWDNLTNKGLIHEPPEEVLVWNDFQADEAVELQGVPRERVRVTGAPNYDHWFDWQPSRTREELCEAVGLRPDRPVVLYVCSSAFIARNEVEFVRRWVAALRERGGALAEAGILVRPHPLNASPWMDADLDDGAAVVWPRFGEEPVAAESRNNYFDSIYHSAAVVGINTSAQIESAIVGRPVHTVLAEEYRNTQQGTLHFHYLQAEEFGHLYVGRTMDEHLDQLEESLRGRDDRERNEHFLRRFVRPFGLDVPATPLLVESIEELAARPAAPPARPPRHAPLVRLALTPSALLMGRRELRARNEEADDPLTELRRTVRRLGSEQTDAPVVAGPWQGDELGEALYWIPFLRWAQIATFELRDRLVVVAPRASAPWYDGIGARLLVAEDVPSLEEALGRRDLRFLPPTLVEARRAELSERHPGERFLRRMLDFEAPVPDEPPADLDLPERFVAVRFHDEALGAGALARLGETPAVPLPDGPTLALSILGRASAFAGDLGAHAILAGVLGRPAVAFDAASASPADLRLAEAFLPNLRVVPPGEASLDALDALEQTAATLVSG